VTEQPFVEPEMGLSQAQRKRVTESQRYALMQYGYHPHSLLWSSKEVQELRFKVLADIGITKGDSVLDVGCGFGDFANYLTKHDTPVKFTGIDVSEALLAEGRRQFPELKLIHGDLFDLNPDADSYDFVTLSGALNRKFDGAVDYTYQTITEMFNASKKGIAFNLLDARHEWTKNRWDLQSFHPDEIIELVKTLSNDYEIIEGYLENDFTVHVLKKYIKSALKAY